MDQHHEHQHHHHYEHDDARLSKIERMLEEIFHHVRRLVRMATDQASFDTALQDFLATQTGLITEIDTAVQAILAKLPPEVDLTAELEAINSAKQGAADATVALQNAITPPVEPPPAP